MAATLTKLAHKIAIQLHLVAEGFTICSSLFRRPVRKRLHTPSHVFMVRSLSKEIILKFIQWYWSSLQMNS